MRPFCPGLSAPQATPAPDAADAAAVLMPIREPLAWAPRSFLHFQRMLDSSYNLTAHGAHLSSSHPCSPSHTLNPAGSVCPTDGTCCSWTSTTRHTHSSARAAWCTPNGAEWCPASLARWQEPTALNGFHLDLEVTPNGKEHLSIQTGTCSPSHWEEGPWNAKWGLAQIPVLSWSEAFKKLLPRASAGPWPQASSVAQLGCSQRAWHHCYRSPLGKRPHWVWEKSPGHPHRLPKRGHGHRELPTWQVYLGSWR